MSLPDGCLVAFYGDDFTGSAAVMEVLTFAGLPTVLFLDTPSEAQVSRFAGYRAIGIAGVARARSPQWMEANLPAEFATLARLDAPIAHYKVCSTFDSAPHVGSIGKAIDLATPVLGGAWHPLLVAAPPIHRYQLFGNLFAAVDGVGYRLDRHPTVSRHPTTPMDEADVRVHLARQTARTIGLVDYLALASGEGEAALTRARGDGAEIVAIDVVDEKSLAEAGRLIWENRGERLLVIGSQGVEYALIAHWRAAGLIGDAPPARETGAARIAAVSGSCSPVTGRQIDWAEANGLAAIRLDVTAAVDEQRWQGVLDAAVAAATRALAAGLSPLVYTARGPDDAAIPALRTAILAAGAAEEDVNARIGYGLGAILKAVVLGADIRRVAIAGGDTSGHALAGLGIVALEAEVALTPACAINIARSDDAGIEGLEVALKGGQMGPLDYFGMIERGRPQLDGVTRR
ncbi:MAG TPA: four-carbon acid sugar kinase family protein [Bauldia sp.]|nr:four-carbon acid sugar kinase family protein [Bauldia sp.]